MAETGSLELFQDLLLKGPPAQKKRLSDALVGLARKPWSRSEKKEADIRAGAGRDNEVLVFEREGEGDLDAASLFLFANEKGLRVTNIVPKNIGELGHSKYNALLQDFITKIAAPASSATGFELELTAARQSLDNWLPKIAADALRRFSASANKSTGSSHPNDRDRWLDFIFKAHQDKGSFDTNLLGRWLVEVEGWPDDVASDLVIEYEFALNLLKKYDQTGR